MGRSEFCGKDPPWAVHVWPPRVPRGGLGTRRLILAKPSSAKGVSLDCLEWLRLRSGYFVGRPLLVSRRTRANFTLSGRLVWVNAEIKHLRASSKSLCGEVIDNGGSRGAMRTGISNGKVRAEIVAPFLWEMFG
jgi:hypothetical protein